MTIALRPNPIAEPVVGQTIEARIHRIWPAAVVALGLALTAAWSCFLGYGGVSPPLLPFFALRFPPPSGLLEATSVRAQGV